MDQSSNLHADALVPEINTITEHLYALFPPAFVQPYPDAWIEIAYAKAGAGNGINEAQNFSVFELREAAEFAEARNKAGFNIYIGPALRQGKQPGNGRADDGNVSTGAYSWTEFDDAGDDERVEAILEQQKLKPGIVTITGTVPNLRAQLFLRLEGNPTAAQLAAANTSLMKLLGTDAVQNASRLMRLAGTVSYPPPKKQARGYITELVTLQLMPDAPAYKVEDLIGLAGPVETNSFLKYGESVSVGTGRDDNELLALLETSRTSPQWHNPIRDAIATMIGRGWPDSAIRFAVAPYCEGGVNDLDLEPLIDGARKKWDKPDSDGVDAGDQQQRKEPERKTFEVYWHGADYGRADRPWLAKNVIPEQGAGLMSGQWGTAKTFAAIALAGSVMTGAPFAGREIVRRGGVLLVAAEGASEVSIRLNGMVDSKLKAEGSLPFAWIEDTPDLKDKASYRQLVETAVSIGVWIKEKFALPLALIIIDTISAAANWKDHNDAAEGQFVMNRLRELGRKTGAVVLAVDHFGKDASTGTRGTTAKEAAADFILATLADRDLNGTLSKTRMAIRKVRGGKTGEEFPFDLEVVPAGFGETTCIITWKVAHGSADTGATSEKTRWPKSLRVFRTSMQAVIAEKGKPVAPYGAEGPTVQAVAFAYVRAEFMAAYPVDDAGDEREQKAAKRAAFGRAIKDARQRELIGSREIGGVDLLWFAKE